MSRLTIGVAAGVHPASDPLEVVRWADQRDDIAGVWFIDHLQGWLPRGVDSGTLGDPHAVLDPFALMAAGAAQSRRVTLGVSVTDPFRRSPAALLQTALSIGWLGKRPIVLGIGTGHSQNLLPYGLERSGSARYMEAACETISTLRGSPEIVSGGSPPWVRDHAVMGMSAEADVRLWVAAHGPRTLDMAARYGDGWLPGMLSPASYAARLKIVRESAELNGRDPKEIRTGMFAWAALTSSRTESLQLLRAPVVRAVALYRSQSAYTKLGSSHPLGEGDVPEYLPATIDPGEAARILSQIPDEVAAQSLLSGSLDDVRSRLEQYSEAGCEHIILSDVGRYVGTEGPERSRECLTYLARGRDGTL